MSAAFGCPEEAAAEVAAEAGDSAVLCANAGTPINVADRIVINSVGVFIAGFCQQPVTIGK